MQETTTGVADAFIFEGETDFLKGADFDGVGKAVEVVSMGKFTPTDIKYGVRNEYGPGGIVTKENYFVKNGLLKEGETFQYTFKENGVVKKFDNSSVSFYFAFTRANPKAGQVVTIKRDKEAETKVNWTIVKA